MSDAGARLLRALIARSGAVRDRILLSDYRATDWQSLIFAGERHQLHLRITGPDAQAIARHITDGLEETEFALPGHIVADISFTGSSGPASDGSVTLDIEALTVTE